jgi:ubiquitin-protein ligase
MYTEGTFLMYLDMDSRYPAFPPKARFVTPMLHPNITRQGKICHSILDRIVLRFVS